MRLKGFLFPPFNYNVFSLYMLHLIYAQAEGCIAHIKRHISAPGLPLCQFSPSVKMAKDGKFIKIGFECSTYVCQRKNFLKSNSRTVFSLHVGTEVWDQ